MKFIKLMKTFQKVVDFILCLTRYLLLVKM